MPSTSVVLSVPVPPAPIVMLPLAVQKLLPRPVAVLRRVPSRITPPPPAVWVRLVMLGMERVAPELTVTVPVPRFKALPARLIVPSSIVRPAAVCAAPRVTVDDLVAFVPAEKNAESSVAHVVTVPAPSPVESVFQLVRVVSHVPVAVVPELAPAVVPLRSHHLLAAKAWCGATAQTAGTAATPARIAFSDLLRSRLECVEEKALLRPTPWPVRALIVSPSITVSRVSSS